MAGFFLNMQILYEQLIHRDISCTLFLKNDALCLKGAQFYTGAETVSREYVYLAEKSTLVKSPFTEEYGALIIMESGQESIKLPENCSCISVSGGQDLFMVFNQIQQIFAYYGSLERRVNEVLNNGGKLESLINIAAEHFQKAVFYHNEFYNIPACSDYSAIAPYISYNEKKSTYVQDAELINQFRTIKKNASGCHFNVRPGAFLCKYVGMHFCFTEKSGNSRTLPDFLFPFPAEKSVREWSLQFLPG